MNHSHSTLQVLPENGSPDHFNVNYIQYLFEETFAQLQLSQPDTLVHLRLVSRGESREFTGSLDYKLRENSYFCSEQLLRSGAYNYELIRHELQLAKPRFNSLYNHQNMPSVETFVRLMAVAGIRYLDDVYQDGELRVSRPEYEHAAHNFITLKQIQQNLRLRFREHNRTIQEISKEGLLSRPTLYKLLQSLDDTVSMRTLINFCLSTNTPLESMVNIEDYKITIEPLETL